MIVVLDSSALMAALFGEKGAEVVLSVDRGSEVSIVAEMKSTVCDRGGDPADINELIKSMGLRVRAFRDAHADEVGRLRPLTHHIGLGFGDRACLAQGRLSDRPILTGDQDWEKLDLGLDIRFFRRHRTV